MRDSEKAALCYEFLPHMTRAVVARGQRVGEKWTEPKSVWPTYDDDGKRITDWGVAAYCIPTAPDFKAQSCAFVGWYDIRANPDGACRDKVADVTCDMAARALREFAVEAAGG